MEIRSVEEFREIFKQGKFRIRCRTVEERYDAVIVLEHDGFNIQPILFDNDEFRQCTHPGYNTEGNRVIAWNDPGSDFIEFTDFMELYDTADVSIAEDALRSVLIV